jgi:hypothetical protein
MVDGVSATDMMTVMFETGGEQTTAEEWEPVRS